MNTFLARNKQLALFFITILTACAAPVYDLTVTELAKQKLSDITIIKQGQTITERATMSDSCKGFKIKETHISNFYLHSALQAGNTNNRLQLPCYAKGTTSISGEKFDWVIRAGGIGEFSNARTSFTKMCGVSCCKKIKAIC